MNEEKENEDSSRNSRCGGKEKQTLIYQGCHRPSLGRNHLLGVKGLIALERSYILKRTLGCQKATSISCSSLFFVCLFFL